MDLAAYIRALRRSWWLVVLAGVLGTSLAYGVAALSTPAYRGSVVFFVSTPADSTSSPFQADQFAQRRVNSYVGLLNSDTMATRVKEATGTPDTLAQVRGSISASADLNTVLLTATVTTGSVEQSLSYATAVAEQFGGLVAEVDTAARRTRPVWSST